MPIATQLNQTCFCISLDRAQMATAMRAATGDDYFFEKHVATRPHLFADLPVFLPKSDRETMLAIVAAIEEVSRLPAYREAAMAWAPTASREDRGPGGVFMGYDFHLAGDAPRLIEINTNAGGALLNTFRTRAQLACCTEVAEAMPEIGLEHFDQTVIAMFETEWRRQGRTGKPRRIAIIDDQPEDQYLYPEFLLARKLFESNGIASVIADPRALEYTGGRVVHQGEAIDLVYNRLVDFALAEPAHDTLRSAWLEGAVVLTPNPHNHALLADKRNLTLLTDPARLNHWSVPEQTRHTLESIPRAIPVTPDNAGELWQRRRNLFFKPVAGHGGKAVYRGDKLTRSTWDNLIKGDYIAQDFAAPGERLIRLGHNTVARKVDVRLYTYDGQLLLAAARLYQGQTTNFRTEGGGFAPVFFI